VLAGGKVCCHDDRRAAIERERRCEHPTVTNWDKVGYPGFGLRFQQRNRVRAVVCCNEICE